MTGGGCVELKHDHAVDDVDLRERFERLEAAHVSELDVIQSLFRHLAFGQFDVGWRDVARGDLTKSARQPGVTRPTPQPSSRQDLNCAVSTPLWLSQASMRWTSLGPLFQNSAALESKLARLNRSWLKTDQNGSLRPCLLQQRSTR